jgi:anti-sigma factor (TIGR02949 family)
MERGTCEEIVRRLDDYLDRELDESEMAVVREHINACEVCANGLEFEDTIISAIRSKLQDAALPDGLKGRVFARLRTMQEDEAGR